jgi:hypothetical protein
MIKNLLKFNELVLEKLVNWNVLMHLQLEQQTKVIFWIRDYSFVSQKLFFPNVERMFLVLEYDIRKLIFLQVQSKLMWKFVKSFTSIPTFVGAFETANYWM